MDVINNRLIRRAIPLFNALALVLLLLAVAFIMRAGKEIFIPIALSILLSFALSPVVSWLQSRGLPKGAAVPLSVLAALALIGALFYLMYAQLMALAESLPSYEPIIKQKIKGLSAILASDGPLSRASTVIQGMIKDLSAIGADKDTAGAAAGAAAVIVANTAEKGGNGIAAILPLLSPLVTMLITILMTVFMLASREDLRNRFIRLAGTDDLQKTTAAIDDAAKRVGKLLLAQLGLNTAFGIVVGASLWMVGLPSPFLWGAIAGIFRFVPYIGAAISVALPALLAFAVDPTWSMLIWTVAIFLVLDLAVGHGIEPLLFGHSTGISPIAVLLMATVWVFLWGPIGLVLATPMTILMVVLGRHIGRLEFLDILLSDRPALEPHEIFYQRMLAGDPEEATRHAADVLKARRLETYYDEIALEAIRRAHQDIIRGSVKDERLETLSKSTQALVEALEDTAPLATREVSAEAQAALEQLRPDRLSADVVLAEKDLPEAWRGKTPVAIITGNHPLDRPVAMMLSQVLDRHGIKSRIASISEAEAATAEERDGVGLVIYSFIEPLSTLHLRLASINVARRLPGAKVMVCIWQQIDEHNLQSLRRKLRVAAVASTMSDALDDAVSIAQALRSKAPRSEAPVAA